MFKDIWWIFNPIIKSHRYVTPINKPFKFVCTDDSALTYEIEGVEGYYSHDYLISICNSGELKKYEDRKNNLNLK